MPAKLLPDDLLAGVPARTTLDVLGDLDRELSESTGRLLEGVIATTPEDNRVQYRFSLSAPVLGVKVPVLRVVAGAAGLPLTVDGRSVQPQVCQSLDELAEVIRAAFAGAELLQTVRYLYAESKRKGRPYFLVEKGEWVTDAMTLTDAIDRAERPGFRDRHLRVGHGSRPGHGHPGRRPLGKRRTRSLDSVEQTRAVLNVLQTAVQKSQEVLMARSRANGSPSPLMVRLDEQSKEVLARAAALRRISVSDYVRQVTVAQAHREVRAAAEQTVALTPEEQLAFWTALAEPVKLTPAQKKLGRLMRGAG